jgi:hypothetical protein
LGRDPSGAAQGMLGLGLTRHPKSTDRMTNHPPHRLSVAPMMDWTESLAKSVS